MCRERATTLWLRVYREQRSLSVGVAATWASPFGGWQLESLQPTGGAGTSRTWQTWLLNSTCREFHSRAFRVRSTPLGRDGFSFISEPVWRNMEWEFTVERSRAGLKTDQWFIAFSNLRNPEAALEP
jgi:hypothetical protein